MQSTNVHTTPPTDEAIHRKLARIRKHAEYLRHWAEDREEHDAARSIQRLSQEIAAMLAPSEGEAA